MDLVHPRLSLEYRIHPWSTGSILGVSNPSLEYRIHPWSIGSILGVPDPSLEYRIHPWSIESILGVPEYKTRYTSPFTLSVSFSVCEMKIRILTSSTVSGGLRPPL